jgi:hypothetical protein
MAFVPEGQADSSQARSASVIDVKRLRPGGTVEVMVSPSVSRIGSIVPLGRGRFPRDSRHFVPGYYRACPSGTKPIAIEVPRIVQRKSPLNPVGSTRNFL